MVEQGSANIVPIKNKVGRPLVFKSVKELEAKIQDYFDWCDNGFAKVVDKDTGEEKLVSKPTPYTMSGLAYALGVDRKTLLNYSHKEEYFPTIKKAKTRIEQSVEERLLGSTGVVAGQIFALKQNFGWDALTNEDDKKEAHITVQILQGYGIKPGEVVIDAEEVKHLKGIASGKEIIDL